MLKIEKYNEDAEMLACIVVFGVRVKILDYM